MSKPGKQGTSAMSVQQLLVEKQSWLQLHDEVASLRTQPPVVLLAGSQHVVKPAVTHDTERGTKCMYIHIKKNAALKIT